MLATLLHVVLFVAAIIGLLAIKQKRLRHIPNRRTHISRRSAEGTIWLQRAVNGALDMLHSALAEQQKAATGSSVNSTQREDATSSPAAATAPSSTASTAKPGPDHESGSDSGAEVVSDLPFLNTLKAQLEEQISALLEDKGIASFADFRIKDWGGKPPLVKAVYLSHGGGANSSSAGISSSNGGVGGAGVNGNVDNVLPGPRGASGGGGGMPGGPVNASAAGSPITMGPQHYPAFGGGPPLSTTTAGRSAPHAQSSSFGGGGGASEALSPSDVPYASMSMRHRSNTNANNSSGSNGEDAVGAIAGRERSLAGSVVHPGRLTGGGAAGMSASDLASGGGGTIGGPATSASFAGGKIASDTTRSLSVLEAEVEVEYSGNFSVSLNADIPIARGRYLQLYAAVSDVRALAAHVRLRLALEYEPATVESPQPQPFLLGTLWLMSDPVFDVAFHSSLTQYRIRDFFLIPKVIKFFLLRFLRHRLRPSSTSSAATANSAAAARHTSARRRRPGGASANGAAGGGGAQGGGSPGGSDEAVADSEHRALSDASGLSFRVQLPAEIVDGGEQWWSAMARDTMSECPAPFLRTYHQ